MMQEEGLVVETRGKIADVRINRAVACAHCKAGCLEQGNFMIAEAENSAGAQAGDVVRLEFNPRAALTASFVVFGIPLLGLLFGVIMANFMAELAGYESHKQILSIGTGAVLFFLSFIPVWLYDRHIKKSGTCNAVIVEILSKPQALKKLEQI